MDIDDLHIQNYGRHATAKNTHRVKIRKTKPLTCNSMNEKRLCQIMIERRISEANEQSVWRSARTQKQAPLVGAPGGTPTTLNGRASEASRAARQAKRTGSKTRSACKTKPIRCKWKRQMTIQGKEDYGRFV